MGRDGAAEARDRASADLAWLVELGVLDEPVVGDELAAVSDETERAFGVGEDPDVLRRQYVRTALRRRDHAFRFSYDCILDYSGYADLIEEYRRIADGHLDGLDYEVGGDWADGEDPELRLTLGDAVFEPDLVHMGDGVDPEFYAVMDRALATTEAARSFQWLVSDTLSLVAFTDERRAAALRVYLDDPDLHLPPAALAGDRAVVDHLDHDDPRVRRAAAAFAAETGIRAALLPIRGLLFEDPDPAVKATCVDALATFGVADHPLVRSTVRDALGADDEVRRPVFAAVADGPGGLDDDLLPPSDPAVGEAVLAALDADDDEIRRHAFAVAAADSRGAETTVVIEDREALAERVADGLADDDPAVRGAAAALARHRHVAVETNLLLRALDGLGGESAVDAIRALGRSGDERAVGPLVGYLESDEPTTVRSAAAAALGDIATPVARQALANALDARSWGLRTAARSALESVLPGADLVDPPASVDGVPPVVEEALDRHDSRGAVTVVGQLDTPAAVDRLVEATRDDHAFVRKRAAAWLAQRPVDEAVPALVALVENYENEAEGTVEHALTGLERADHPLAAETLERVAAADDPLDPDSQSESAGADGSDGETTLIGAVLGAVLVSLIVFFFPTVLAFRAAYDSLEARSVRPAVELYRTDLAEMPVFVLAGHLAWALLAWLVLVAL